LTLVALERWDRIGFSDSSTMKRFDGNVASGKRFLEVSSDDGVIEFPAARKNIHRRVVVFGPGVNGDVRLCDHHHSADTIRAEVVEHGFDNRSMSGPNRRQ